MTHSFNNVPPPLIRIICREIEPIPNKLDKIKMDREGRHIGLRLVFYLKFGSSEQNSNQFILISKFTKLFQNSYLFIINSHDFELLILSSVFLCSYLSVIFYEVRPFSLLNRYSDIANKCCFCLELRENHHH